MSVYKTQANTNVHSPVVLGICRTVNGNPLPVVSEHVTLPSLSVALTVNNNVSTVASSLIVAELGKLCITGG